MELNELAAFVKVVQSGSFTRAADLLGTQKAHLSRVVTGLERKLGVRLIERTTRSLSLTEVGREIFERAIGILAAVEDTERVAQQMLGEPRGVLRLTCGVEFGMLAVSRWVIGYLQRFPDVRVEADYTGRLVDLVHEGFDLAIRVGELPDSRLAARRLGELRYGLFASPDYLARTAMPETPQELASHALLAYAGGNQRQGWRLERGGEVVTVDAEPRLRVDNSFSVADAAKAGLGIAQLPLMVAHDALAAGTLRRVLPGWARAPVPVSALFPSARYLTPKVRAFIDHAAAQFDALRTND
ncbi:LysR substrate-binding domain-containing protein [Niveibacterium sp.]|uniref:LysR family transcriptional regulator n=1 Tax=Niveibacterium sp. TaxID=2017444 RepID=UPI0035AFACD8